jgi:hypothetical protein
MNNVFRSLCAVLWASVGLGGRRADAEQRMESTSVVTVLFIALALVILFIVTLLGVARFAAG